MNLEFQIYFIQNKNLPMIPVDRQSKDPFFRYKMPQVSIANDASKTIILNLDIIAKAICRNPQHILKFLSINFGCTCVFTPRYALNGTFDIQKVQSGIYDFIDIFVLCKACRNPETKFVYEENLKRLCNSCGSLILQENNKLNSTIMKDKDKSSNEDTKYDASNKNSIGFLIKQEGDQSHQIYDCYKQEGLDISNLFSEYLKPKDLKQLELVFKEFKLDQILENIENMLEANKKEDKIELFLNSLVKIGYTVAEIEEYFSKPRKDKKRSPLIKKNVDFFLNNQEE